MFIRRKELKRQLAEAQQAIEALTQEKESLQVALEGYHVREQELVEQRAAVVMAQESAGAALEAARQEAARMVEAAQSEAASIRTDAQQQAQTVMDATHYRAQQMMRKTQEEADTIRVEASQAAETLLAETRSKSDGLLATAVHEAELIRAKAQEEARVTLQQAKQEADATIQGAREQASALLKRTEDTVREYDGMIAAYNAQLEATAAEAAAQARRLAAFTRTGHIASPNFTEETEGMHSIPVSGWMDLEDAGDDPAKVMQNIYRLQHRKRPESDPNELPQLFNTNYVGNAGQKPVVQEEDRFSVEAEPVPEPVVKVVPQELPMIAEDEEPLPTLDSVIAPDQGPEEPVELDGLIDEILRTVHSGADHIDQ